MTMPIRVQTMPINVEYEVLPLSLRDDAFEVAHLISLSEALAQDVAKDVEDQRHDEKSDASGKDRLITDASMRQITEADLYDESRDRRRGFSWIKR